MSLKRKFTFHDGKAGAALAVKVVPRASKNELVEIRDDGTVKIRIKAAPVDGKANLMLVEYLSEVLGVSKSKLEIVTGLTGKEKLVTVMGMTPAELQAKLVKLLE